jgi:hypothetical protein
MAFGEILPAEDFIELIVQAFEPSIKIGDWMASLKTTPTIIEMGQERIGKLLVEYVHPTGSVYQRMFSSTEGTPDVEAEMKAAVDSCYAVAMPAPMPRAAQSRPPQSRGPVAVISNGWGSTASVAQGGEDPVRNKLLQAFSGEG